MQGGARGALGLSSSSLSTVESVHDHSSSVLSDGKRDPLRPVLSKSESGEGARQTLANVILLLELFVLTFKLFPQKEHFRAPGSRTQRTEALS